MTHVVRSSADLISRIETWNLIKDRITKSYKNRDILSICSNFSDIYKNIPEIQKYPDYLENYREYLPIKYGRDVNSKIWPELKKYKPYFYYIDTYYWYVPKGRWGYWRRMRLINKILKDLDLELKESKII